MDRIVVRGSGPLRGETAVSGSKNAALASGNGLPASGPIETRDNPARAMKTDAFDSSTTLRPSR